MRDLIEHGLEQTASLWPDIERAYKWIHRAAHILNNHDDEDAATVQRRFNGLLGAMVRHRNRAGSLSEAIDQFGKVTRSYRPGLFHCYAVPDLPRTNNDLEHEFGSQRYHERLVASIATRRYAPSGPDLGCVDRERWKDLRQRLDRRRQARTLRTRFRHDPATYLAELEEKARQLTLPA